MGVAGGPAGIQKPTESGVQKVPSPRPPPPSPRVSTVRARSAPCGPFGRHVLARVAGLGAPVGHVGTRVDPGFRSGRRSCRSKIPSRRPPAKDPPSATTGAAAHGRAAASFAAATPPRFAAQGRTYISAEGGGRGDARESRRAKRRVVVLGDDQSRGVARRGLPGDGGAQPTGDGGAKSHGVRR